MLRKGFSTALLLNCALGAGCVGLGGQAPKESSSTHIPAQPGPRSAALLVYDDRQHKLVLTDGYRSAATPALGELWTWDGKRWARLAASGPPGRRLSAAAFDGRRKRLVIHGGLRPPRVRMSDSWEWDGNRWRQITDSSPGPRDHHAMAFDAARGNTVMFGGDCGGGPTPLSECRLATWSWDGRAWTQVASSGPAGRGRTAMVYDAKRREVVLFGGFGDSSTLFNDTWIWNGTAWRKASDTGPPARYAHALAFDARAGVVLLYGGSTLTEHFTDMWQWDGERWTEIKMTGPTPGTRYSPAFAYDPRRRVAVLYGGTNAATDEALDDTWEWNGERWARVE